MEKGPARLPQKRLPRSMYTETHGRYPSVTRLVSSMLFMFSMKLQATLWKYTCFPLPQGIGSPRISAANGTLLWESLDFLMTLEKQPSPPPASQNRLQATVSDPLPGEPFSSHCFHLLQLLLVLNAASHLLRRPFLFCYSLPVG